MAIRLLIVAIVAVAFVVAVAAAIGFYYAGEIRAEALNVDHSDAERDLVVAAVGDGTITLATTDASDAAYGDWRHPGWFGLDGPGGYAQIGPIVDLGDDRATRAFEPVAGEIAAGDPVKIEIYGFNGTPGTAHGLSVEDVTFASDIGELGAWRTPGRLSTWAVFVHGRAAERRESLRALSTFADLGLPTLSIDYRNDRNAPRSASGFYDFGLSEWRDLEAAVRYALDEGAEDVVLTGFSMGGGIVTSFLLRSELADRVRAVVFDAPMLDFGDVVRFGAERRRLPAFLTWLGKAGASVRYGVDWEALDYVARADEFDVPILLFHGDRDRLVHVRTSDTLAEALPDLVTYVRLEDVDHVRAWNVDPVAYDSAIRAFLRSVGL